MATAQPSPPISAASGIDGLVTDSERNDSHVSRPEPIESLTLNQLHSADYIQPELPPSLGDPENQIPYSKRDWRNSLFPNENPMVKFKLRFIPPSARKDSMVGVCSKAAVDGELVILDMTLVGFFLGKKPSFSFVKAALLRQWKLKGRVEIMQLTHGGFAFRFTKLEDRDAILDGNVFFVGGQPMFIRQWDRSLHTGGILGLRKVPLWVTLPGLPLHLWGVDSLSSICSVLGNPLYSDRTTAMKTRLMFARVCVEFSGESPLLDSITIEDEVGLKYEQKVQYEWRPPHCLSCGVFGHSDCSVQVEVAKNCAAGTSVLESGNSVQTDALKTRQDSIEPDGMIKEQEHIVQLPETEKGLDEGWKIVRARKNRSGGFEAGIRTHTRPVSTGGKKGNGADVSGGNVVSMPHRPSLVPDPADQVLPSESFPKYHSFSNSNSCSKSAPCPPYPMKNVDMEKDCSDLNLAPNEPKNSNQSAGSSPPCSSSTAGHTPYRNRVSLLARDLRTRKFGLGLSNLANGIGYSAGRQIGPDLEAQQSTTSTTHEELRRPGKVVWNGPGPISKPTSSYYNKPVRDSSNGLDDRNNDQVGDGSMEDPVSDFVTHQKDHEQIHQTGGNVLKDVARKGAHASKIGRDNEEVGQHTELGHGLAETQ